MIGKMNYMMQMNNNGLLIEENLMKNKLFESMKIFSKKKTLLFIRVLKSSEGPYVRLTNNNDFDGSADPVSDKSS